MTFNDKFKFLMDITNTNNTTLAGAVGIDNSAVSLYAVVRENVLVIRKF